ncbi:MAG: periplasmic divalent cation tolerance protein [Oceanicaulis sp. HLUCCA04]|nr:MAG: periplasmic divalent cation tolerance protein [Oceanicaulis sp. HLUCCA04]
MTMHTDQSEDGVVVLYTTWPDEASASAAARTLLDEKLIACVNILPAGRSIFRWDGAVTEEAETIALFKTAKARASDARTRLVALHPYDEPCVLALPADTPLSAGGFVSWVMSETP